jgi:chromate transporter
MKVAAVVGIIAATFIQLAMATAQQVREPIVGLIIFGLALAVAWRVRRAWVTPAIVAGGAVVGYAFMS